MTAHLWAEPGTERLWLDPDAGIHVEDAVGGWHHVSGARPQELIDGQKLKIMLPADTEFQPEADVFCGCQVPV